MQQTELAIHPNGDSRVGDIEPLHSACCSDDVSGSNLIRDIGDPVLRNIHTGRVVQFGLDGTQRLDELGGLLELPIRACVGRHEVDRLGVLDPSDPARDVLQYSEAMVV